MQDKLRKDILKNLLMTTKKNITDEQLNLIIESSESTNIISCIDYLLSKYSSLEELYASEDYKKLINLFKKTRVKEFPSLDFYQNITLDLSQKFKLKVYRLFSNSHLFSDGETLVNMIAVAGLFEDDQDSQKRINEIVKIFFYQTVYGITESLSDKKDVIEKTITLYELDENIWPYIPEELKPYIFENITPNYYSFLKNMVGNFGRKINDFLSPYNPEGEIKKGVKTNDLLMSYIATQEEYYRPFKKDKTKYFSVDTKVQLDRIKEALKLFEEYELTYGPSDIKSMFKKCKPVFDKEFYDYFIRHQTDIQNSRNSFSKLPFIQEKFHEILKYYKERGNNDPDFITMIELLRTVPYDVKFGDEDFAYEARNAGVLNETYPLYEELLNKVRKRYKRVLPNHQNSFQVTARDGKTYTVKTEILEGTKYLNMLIGESKYTDCCQKMDDLGIDCLNHASASKCGGIFLISLVTDEGTFPLSQSWIWINEQELVLDNIEQTLFLKIAPSKKREIYEDIIAETVKAFGKDIIKTSNQTLNEYIEKEMSKEDISPDKLKRLKEIALRQSIKVVSLGSGYSDIIVSDYFDTQAERKLYLPKDYKKDGYTDAKTRYVVAGNEKNITVEPNDDFEEEPIYRIPRRINHTNIFDVSTSVIKRILDIDNNERVTSLEQFYLEYELSKEDKVIYGEDWYIIYHLENDEIQIIRSNCGRPRLDDEQQVQQEEFNKNMRQLEESNKTDNKVKRKV